MIAIDVLRKAMREIASQKGDFTLFALFRRADAHGKWDLVVSAPWLEGNLDGLVELVGLLAKSIGEGSLRQFARVEAVPSDSSVFKVILANSPADDGERRIQSTDLFDVQIEEAIILRAKRPSRNKPARKALQPVGGGSFGSR